MRYDEPLTPCTLLKRYKRFLADVRLGDGAELTVHCPNTGAMTGCAEPGCRAWISDSHNPKRKLRHTLEQTEVDGVRIHVHSQRAGAVVAEAAREGRIAELAGYETVRTEVKYGERSRIDVLLQGEGRPDCWVEVKSVTLGAGGGLVRFPDAPSARGARHLAELAAQVEAGDRAVMLFLAGRTDAERVSPADDIDPAYGVALRDAMARGVEVLAYTSEITAEGIWLADAVEVVV